MKVAQINTHTYGGAAIVAKRVHKALLALKTDSLLFTKFGVEGAIPKHAYLKDGRFRNFVVKMISDAKYSGVANFLLGFLKHPNLKARPEGFEIFSPLSHAPVTEQFDILEDRDILHLHWVNEFFDYQSFFKRFSHKKFVWTLHDMNTITGGCHHSDGCMKFESSCIHCPQLKGTIDDNYSKLVQESKINALSLLKDEQLIIASPSHWLSDLSKRSKITSRFKHVILHNPSFDHVGPLTEMKIARQKAGLPLDKKILMFVSGNLNNTRKGIGLLLDAVRSMPDKDNILILGIGHKAKPQPGLNIMYTGNISNIELLANYFYASDLFVTPSLAENSPLVVIESLCCGTPVVGSDIGGIPDLVNNDNGILFKTGDVDALSKAIASALFEKTFDHEKLQVRSLEAHSPEKVAIEHKKLYELF
jgi:glycosyltransferase involved in cell wall biosynthesis